METSESAITGAGAYPGVLGQATVGTNAAQGVSQTAPKGAQTPPGPSPNACGGEEGAETTAANLLSSVRLASEIEVPAEGKPSAKIWLIGEAPGETEVRERRPFCGQAGKVLDGLLAEAGINRKDCYVANIVPYRPLGNRFEEFYKKDGSPSALLERSREALRARIRDAKPHVVIALGAEPLKNLAAGHFEGGITAWRGSVIAGPDGAKILASYHPSYLLRSWSDRPLAVHDLRRGLVESREAGLKKRPRETTINWSFERLRDALIDLQHAKKVAFDIETSQGEITSIALAPTAEFAVVVPLAFRGRRYWSAEEERILKGFTREVLEDPKVLKIAQNAQYDMIWLADKWGVKVAPLYMDTLVAHNLSMPEYDKSLAFQCSIYTDINYYKFNARTDDPDTYSRYNAMDAMATFECAEQIEKHLREDGLWDFYRTLPHALLEPLREMSLRGIRVDTVLRDAMIRENSTEKAALVTAMREDSSIVAFERDVLQGSVVEKLRKAWQASVAKCEASGKFPKSCIAGKYPKFEDYLHFKSKDLPSFNPDSTKQLQDYLYKYRKFQPIFARRNDGSRTLTADAAAIKKIQTKAQEPILQAFLDFADLAKEGEFLGAKLEPDGRMHCTYDITGTETGRLSSKKYVYDTGANLQNQPAGKKKESSLRRIFVPDSGKVFIQRDLKQAEAWIVAFESEDPFFMDAIRSTDIHRRTASLIFRKPEAEISKRERDLAKRCVHALNYGMGYIKFAEQIGISIVEARDLRNRYFAAFPKLGLWHSTIKLRLERTRELKTPMGRKRQFSAGWNEDLWKEAWAYVPQSTVGDLLNVGFLEFWRWLKAPVDANFFKSDGKSVEHVSNEEHFDCQIMLQIHDSLVVQCPPEHAELIAAKLKSCLEREIVVNGHRITIPTDCSMGPNWLDLKEVKE